MSPKFLHYPGC